jgi:hypothetical protein
MVPRITTLQEIQHGKRKLHLVFGSNFGRKYHVFSWDFYKENIERIRLPHRVYTFQCRPPMPYHLVYAKRANRRAQGRGSIMASDFIWSDFNHID